jgi:diguanylate cyclase (GGDEF)-like protein
MSRPSPASEFVPGQPGPRFDPYVRLARSLLPRTGVVAMFGPSGELMWSTDPMTGPDLINIVDDAILTARSNPDSPGQLRLLEGNLPVYLCALRDEQGGLLALLAVVCRASEAQDKRLDFNFAYSLLAPMLECLRRELMARATIDELTHTVGGLDKDLHLLLGQGAPEGGNESAHELHHLLQQTIEHLRATTGTLLVPEKGVTLVRAARGVAPDTRFLMRAHRRLLTLAQGQREPLVLNDTHSADNPEGFPYRVLCCALRSRTGRSIGVLALLRETSTELFSERDAHIAQILARKALGVIESSYDALSGLYTRNALERRVRALHADLKETQAQAWSALYIDVDRLHAINDGCGMHVGDALLTQLGELIRQRLPPGAFGARLSGDRFAVVLPAQVHDAHGFAESLREGSERLAVLQGEPRLAVSISAGVAQLDGAASELAHVLASAESACRLAKERGRNRVEVHQANDSSSAQRAPDSGIAAQLREAIDKNRLHLDAQLILPLAAAESARPHYELLLRMRDAAGRSVGPDSFLAAASRYQLMPLIDRWVVNHVIESLKPRAGVLEGKALGFTINFSGQSLNDDGFADWLIEAVQSSGLDPELFCFEITENATVANLARAEALMRRLRRTGCGVALDDFGTGLSSLSCLRQLPVTMLKIDGSFVRDVLKDPRAESMVRAIAQLARSMSITTVAEYIETEAISARIAELGVDYGQGFAIGRPIPLADLLTELPLPNEAEAAAAATASGSDAAAQGDGDAGGDVTWYAGAAR